MKGRGRWEDECIDMRIEDRLTERQRDIQTETLIKREVVKGRRGQVKSKGR
jgi:hypothetical protein